MNKHLLQDWVHVIAAQQQASITQPEDGWLYLDSEEDVVFHVQCRAVEPNGATNIVLDFETAADREESLFVPMTGASVSPLAQTVVPVVVPVLLAASAIPVARVVRWKLSASNPQANWGAHFRVYCLAGARR